MLKMSTISTTAKGKGGLFILEHSSLYLLFFTIAKKIEQASMSINRWLNSLHPDKPLHRYNNPNQTTKLE